jgi:small subunit ribosomal protein S20
MANIKSAEKRILQNERRRERNRAFRSRMRTAVKRLRTAIDGGDAEAAKELLPPTLQVIDETAQKGIVHRNTAARSKSRLTKAVNGLG